MLNSRGCGAEQATSCDEKHGQTGQGDGGAPPRARPAGSGEGHPAGPAGQRSDPERPRHCEYTHLLMFT